MVQYERGQPSVWIDIWGNVIPEERMDQITVKYYLPPEKDQALLGNYWWVVRIRGPAKGTSTWSTRITPTGA